MTQTIQPLKNNWRVEEDAGFVKDQIHDRVQSEDLYMWAKGYPIIRTADIKGRIGQPVKD